MKPSDFEKFEKLVEAVVDEKLQELYKTTVNEEMPERKYKSRVERFFSRLERSALAKLMAFKTPQEQAQAIVRFANMVGVPKSQLARVMSSLRSSSRTPETEEV